MTLELFPPDLLILPLQKPNGKWFSPSAVTCSIVQALAMKGTSRSFRLAGLTRAPFATLMTLHQRKAIVTHAPEQGYIHTEMVVHGSMSPTHME